MGCIYDEEQALSRAIAVKDGTSLHYFYLNKLILYYLFGEYEQAAKTATLAEQYLYRALKGERTRTDDLEIHRGNTIIPVEIWGTPVFDEQGKVAYAIATFQDITERKKAEQLLADYNRTLEQQVAERTVLLCEEIEERQRIETALRQSEEQRRLTMDFTHIGSWNWNIIENTVDWNDNHARLLGLVPSTKRRKLMNHYDEIISKYN
jgi:PAS domain-containing protein